MEPLIQRNTQFHAVLYLAIIDVRRARPSCLPKQFTKQTTLPTEDEAADKRLARENSPVTREGIEALFDNACLRPVASINQNGRQNRTRAAGYCIHENKDKCMQLCYKISVLL